MKFGIGLQLVKINKDEFIKIIDKYHEHIEYIYYSTLLDYKFYGRRILKVSEMERFKNIKEKDQYEILKYAKDKYGIKSELCVNSYRCNNDDEFIEMFKYEISKYKPNKCVTFNRIVDKLHNIDNSIKYELSFNNGLYSLEDINDISKNFSSIVIGGRFIRDKNMISKIKDSGFIPNILLNNSCSHNCNYCAKSNCLSIFNYNLERCNNDINIPFSIQTLMPFEIYNNKDIYSEDNYYKLSTRLCDYEELNYLLDSFVNNNNKVNGYKEFHSICPLRHFEKYYEDIDLNKVINLKNKIWKYIK